MWLGTPQTPLNLFVFRVAAASRPQTERGEVGRSRSGKPLLSGASDPVAESCGGQALGRRASASRRHDKLCLRCVAGARDCASPAVAVADARGAPQRSTNPATTGCPAAAADCRRSQPCESRGEWRGHSSGRRVVAASVPTASAPAPSALAAEYQPGYDGLPGGAQGLRALASMTIRPLSGSTKLATKLECPVEPDALKRGIVAASSPGAAPGSPRPIRKAGGGRSPRSAPSWREPPSRGRDSPR